MRQSAHPGCAGSIALPPNSPLCPWRARSATALRDKAAVETPAAGASGPAAECHCQLCRSSSYSCGFLSRGPSLPPQVLLIL